jgi:hypothetical protein
MKTLFPQILSLLLVPCLLAEIPSLSPERSISYAPSQFDREALASPGLPFLEPETKEAASIDHLVGQASGAPGSVVSRKTTLVRRVGAAWKLQSQQNSFFRKISRTTALLLLPIFPSDPNSNYIRFWEAVYQMLMGRSAKHFDDRRSNEATLDMERVGLYGKFTDGERQALREAAAALNQFVKKGIPLHADRLHELHTIASAATRLHRAQGENPDGTLNVIPLRTFLPPFFRGRFRDGKKYKLKMRTIDGKMRERRMIFDIRNYDHWEPTVPASWVKENMDFILEWVNERLNNPNSPIFLAAMAYVMFGKTHPYVDVNDRTGWLLMNWILLSQGQAPFYVTEENLQAYLDAGDAVMEKPLEAALVFYRHVFQSLYEHQNPASTTARAA